MKKKMKKRIKMCMDKSFTIKGIQALCDACNLEVMSMDMEKIVFRRKGEL